MLGINDVKALLSQTNERTLTLFVDVDNATRENQASVPAWNIWIRNQLDSFGKQFTGDEANQWDAIRERVAAFASSYTPSNKTLVIFANESDLTTYELPMKLDENQLSFGRPQVNHLLWMIDEYEPYLLVLVDQEKARFFVTYLGSVGFQGGLKIDIEQYDFRERDSLNSSRGGTGGGIGAGSGAGVGGGTEGGTHGMGDEKFEAMIDEHRNRFYREIVDHVTTLQKQHQTDRIIIGGSEQAGHAVRNAMHAEMQKRVVGVVGIPLHETPEQILQRVQPLALEFERKQEFELVSQVIDFAKSGGRGALGRAAVNEALEMQRVETLVLIWPSANEVEDNELAFHALQLNSDVELVHGEAADLLHSEGDVAARLYYTL